MIVKRILVFCLSLSVGSAFQTLPWQGSPFNSRTVATTTSPNYVIGFHMTKKPKVLLATSPTATQHPSHQPRGVFSMWNRAKRGLRNLLSNRRLGARLAALAMAMLLFVGSAVGAPSGGRVGGSRTFRPTTRSSGTYRSPTRTSTTMRRPTPMHPYRNRPMIPSYYGYGRNMRPDPRIHVVPRRTDGRWAPQDIAIVAGAGAVVTYGIVNQVRDQWNEWPSTDSPLGPGMTVGSLTVALEVPNRKDPSNILTRLNRLAVAADTVTQEGLADLLVDVAVELLRQERSISSAHAQSNHYRIYGQAELNKFGSKDKSEIGDGTDKSIDSDFLSPTLAVVTLNYAIRGAATKMKDIFTRDDLKSALSQISADASVADALVAAEVLWSPEDVTETLEPDVAYADFPQLVPI